MKDWKTVMVTLLFLAWPYNSQSQTAKQITAVEAAEIQTKIYLRVVDNLLERMNPEFMTWLKGFATEATKPDFKLPEKKITQKLADDIRYARRSAQELRSVLKTLGSKSDVPERFNKFIVELGQFRDSLEAEAGYAKKAQKFLEAYMTFSQLKAEISNFRPSPPTDLRANLLEKVKELSSAYPDRPVAPDETHTLQAEEYHDLRKNFRDFEILFYYYRKVTKDKSLREIEDLLGEVSSKMGTRNDEYEREKLIAREQEKQRNLEKGKLIALLNSDLQVPKKATLAADYLRVMVSGSKPKTPSLYPKKFRSTIQKIKNSCGIDFGALPKVMAQ